jgi:hypothetical protein
LGYNPDGAADVYSAPSAAQQEVTFVDMESFWATI